MKKKLLVIFLILGTLYSKAQITPPGLDPTFGNHGMVLDSFSGIGFDVLVQPDGKIVTAGWYLNRYLPSGKLDSSFGINGSVEPSGSILKVQILPNGKLIVVAFDSDFGYVIRYYADGQIDSTFGTDGITKSSYYDLNSMLVAFDNSIFIAGINDDFFHSVSVWKYRPDGQPDSSFGINGNVLTGNFPYPGNVSGIGIMSDGRITLGGIGYNPSGFRSAMLMRYLPDGSLDTTLNHSGIAYPVVVDYCRSTILQPDGKPLLALGGLGGDGYVLRLNLDGSIDSSYGEDGFAIIPAMRIASMILQPNGELLCGGDDGDFVLARLRAEGQSLDSSFGINGVIRTDISGTNSDRLYGIALQSDQKIIGVGQSGPGLGHCLAVLRYNADAAVGVGVANTGSQSIGIYPNPAHDYVTVVLPQALQENARYDVYSLEGRRLQSGVIKNRETVLSVADLVPGSYVLAVSAQGFAVTKLFTRQ